MATLKKAPRTWQEVISHAKAQRASNSIVHSFGQCLGTSRQLYGLPLSGIKDATTAYKLTDDIHTGTPPVGAHVLWTGGAHGHGHSAVSAGGGNVYSVDIGGQPRIYLTSIATINRTWGALHYEGWATDYAGKYRLSVKGYDASGKKITPHGSAVVIVAKLNGRKGPSTSSKVRVVRAKGFKVDYVNVVEGDGRTWLKTAWGTYYAADMTTYKD